MTGLVTGRIRLYLLIFPLSLFSGLVNIPRRSRQFARVFHSSSPAPLTTSDSFKGAGGCVHFPSGGPQPRTAWRMEADRAPCRLGTSHSGGFILLRVAYCAVSTGWQGEGRGGSVIRFSCRPRPLPAARPLPLRVAGNTPRKS